MPQKGHERKLDYGEIYARQNEFSKKRKEYKRLLSQWFECQCGKCGTTENIEMDHVTAITVGGINHVVNLQFLCRPCNTLKCTETTDYRPPVIVRLMHLTYFQQVISTVDLERKERVDGRLRRGQWKYLAAHSEL